MTNNEKLDELSQRLSKLENSFEMLCANVNKILENNTSGIMDTLNMHKEELEVLSKAINRITTDTNNRKNRVIKCIKSE